MPTTNNQTTTNNTNTTDNDADQPLHQQCTPPTMNSPASSPVNSSTHLPEWNTFYQAFAIPNSYFPSSHNANNNNMATTHATSTANDNLEQPLQHQQLLSTKTIPNMSPTPASTMVHSTALDAMVSQSKWKALLCTIHQCPQHSRPTTPAIAKYPSHHCFHCQIPHWT